jgi:hypothetical protein
MRAYSLDLRERVLADCDAEMTIREVEDYLGELSAAFAPDECRNYFRSCGYPDARPDREPL